MAVDNSYYDRPGDIWWDDRSPLSCLGTALNPVRLPYFRDVLVERLGWDPKGKSALDVGCGGGLLAEEVAGLGCRVTGVDPSGPSIAIARAHALTSGLEIDYRQASGESLPFPDRSFDIAFCCDVLEHVASVDAVIGEIARVLRPGGVLLYDTINRTALSRLVVVKVAQDWLKIAPHDFHVSEAFVKPAELKTTMARHGLADRESVGLRPGGNPLAMLMGARRIRRGDLTYGEFGRRGRWVRTRSRAISYMGWAIRGS
jgi:2-polyprenyl-6-hydroxyphenyl methylase/3-demethylubiquinone-9 3-methyltransferase